jgi:translation initiation factor IF-2
MSDTDNDKPKLGMRAPLGVKRTVETGKVKQSFSHGRSNTVVVEVKRRRILGKPGEADAAPVEQVEAAPASAPTPAVPAAPAPAAPVASPPPPPPPVHRPQDSLMSRQELQARLLREADEARMSALEDARRREEQQKIAAAEDAKRRAEQSSKAEEEPASAPSPAAQPAAAEPAPAATPAAVTATAPESAPAAATTEAPRQEDNRPAPRKFTPVPSPKRPEPPARPARPRSGDDRRQSGKLTVTKALDDSEGARARSLAALKRAREKERRAHFAGSGQPQVKQVRDVVVPEGITVQELANRMAEKGADLVKALFKMGVPVTVTQTIDQDTAELLVTEFGHNIKRVSDADIEIDTAADVDASETMLPRPPVVTIMGHVDHGKTSLLDALRGTDVVSGEAGGITQHIGAYQVQVKSGDKITFLDTPGHEAFTDMRARGANVTDIVVLVVAADDGLMPQTIEAIRHTKAAGVPMIVAINKIDKEGANPQRVRERLLEHEVVVEDMGGDVQDVEVSALKRLNLDALIDKILIQAELLELRANPDRPAEGTVIEAKLDKGRGPVATVLVGRGTLRVGDIFVVGQQSGKVRAMVNDKGQQIKEAGPSMPVEVLGLSGTPGAGDPLSVVENEARAREVAAYREEVATRKRTATAPPSLDTMFSSLQANKAIEYAVVVKADVQGSTEAIVAALHKISTDEIKVRVLHSGVGAITESDVTLAKASNAPIIGFNVRPNAKAREIGARDKVRFKYFDVIYHLTDDIRSEMAGELGPEAIETVVGRAEIRDVFSAGKHGKAAGLLVTEGVIRKALKARITRDDVIIYNGEIASLRRFKDDVAEVRAGLECGVTFTQNFTDIRPGDYLETFEVEMRERTL